MLSTTASVRWRYAPTYRCTRSHQLSGNKHRSVDNPQLGLLLDTKQLVFLFHFR
ncbi:hypothetical protein [Nostoc flagelliforme]|uniref:hypothetical protein n=1 Tax=Nostoc flagelliforme TaxID=1306274 RepID=UPI0030DC6A8E